MPPEALDKLEAKLDPAARVVVALLREENAEQKRRIEASSAQIAALTSQLGLLTEQIARQTEQLEDLRRRLFGNRAEKLPTVKEELRRRVDPEELTVDGTPMPTEPEARAKEKRRKSRKAGEAQRKAKRGLRKDLPVVVEEKSVTAEQLPEGYTLEDFRKLGDGKIVMHVEHVREHLVIQRFALETLISKDGEHIITAEGPPSVIDGGHYGPSLCCREDSLRAYAQDREQYLEHSTYLPRDGGGLGDHPICSPSTLAQSSRAPLSSSHGGRGAGITKRRPGRILAFPHHFLPAHRCAFQRSRRSQMG